MTRTFRPFFLQLNISSYISYFLILKLHVKSKQKIIFQNAVFFMIDKIIVITND